MVFIFPRRRRRQTYDIFGFHFSHRLLEGKSGDVVTFVNDDLTVFGNEVLHRFLLIETLNDRNIDTSCPTHFSAANVSNRVCGHVQEHGQPFLPLIERLPPVNQNQRIDTTFSDEPGC
jgi:hypothetical protein